LFFTPINLDIIYVEANALCQQANSSIASAAKLLLTASFHLREPRGAFFHYIACNVSLKAWSACHSAGDDPPGQANLAICSSAVGQRYKCLAFTLEMPFKDTNYANEPVQVSIPIDGHATPCALSIIVVASCHVSLVTALC